MDDGLLMLFITGEADEKQLKEVQEWLDLSDDNQVYLDQMQDLWLKSAELDLDPIIVDIDKAWDNVASKIDDLEDDLSPPITNSNSKTSSHKLVSLLYRIAAVLIVAAGLYVIFNISRTKDDLVLIASNEVVIKDTLSDGSIVSLNKNSSLSYPENFDSGVREVALEGEAFFEVERNPNQEFIVSAGESYIKVLGTSFNVESYRDSNYVEVSVVSGIVQLYTLDDDLDTMSVLLEKNEIGIYDLNTRTVHKKTSKLDNDLYWATKTLVFEKTPLSKVFQMLEITFNVNIETLNPEVSTYLFSATFIDNSVQEILDVVSATFDLKVEKNGNNYDISKNNIVNE